MDAEVNKILLEAAV